METAQCCAGPKFDSVHFQFNRFAELHRGFGEKPDGIHRRDAGAGIVICRTAPLLPDLSGSGCDAAIRILCVHPLAFARKGGRGIHGAVGIRPDAAGGQIFDTFAGRWIS